MFKKLGFFLFAMGVSASYAIAGGGVPVVLIGNRKIQGFNTGALEAALKKI